MPCELERTVRLRVSSIAPMTFARTIYSALAWAAQPLLRRKLRRRAVAEPGYAVAVPERFGYYTPADLGRDG